MGGGKVFAELCIVFHFPDLFPVNLRVINVPELEILVVAR